MWLKKQLCRPVHHFGPEWNISTTVGWKAMNFGTDICVSHRGDCNNFWNDNVKPLYTLNLQPATKKYVKLHISEHCNAPNTINPYKLLWHLAILQFDFLYIEHHSLTDTVLQTLNLIFLSCVCWIQSISVWWETKPLLSERWWWELMHWESQLSSRRRAKWFVCREILIQINRKQLQVFTGKKEIKLDYSQQFLMFGELSITNWSTNCSVVECAISKCVQMWWPNEVSFSCAMFQT